MKALAHTLVQLFSAMVLALILMSGNIHYLSHSEEEHQCQHHGKSHFHETEEPCGLCDFHFSIFKPECKANIPEKNLSFFDLPQKSETGFFRFKETLASLRGPPLETN